MNTEDFKQLLSTYQDASKLRPIGPWMEITTQHLDRHGDYLQIYARYSDVGYGVLFTDDGHTLRDLKDRGFNEENPTHRGVMSKNLAACLSGPLRVYAPAEPDALAACQRDLLAVMVEADQLVFRGKKAAHPPVRQKSRGATLQ